MSFRRHYLFQGILALGSCLVLALSAFAQTGSASTEGHPFLPAKLTGGLCTTRVSPTFPVGAPAQPAAVTLRVSISRVGRLTPLYRVSGPRQFEVEAMNAARLWQCKPYSRPTSPTTLESIDILTEITVTFTPGKPAGFVSHGPK